jgi:hypothetical protein
MLLHPALTPSTIAFPLHHRVQWEERASPEWHRLQMAADCLKVSW